LDITFQLLRAATNRDRFFVFRTGVFTKFLKNIIFNFKTRVKISASKNYCIIFLSFFRYIEINDRNYEE